MLEQHTAALNRIAKDEQDETIDQLTDFMKEINEGKRKLDMQIQEEELQEQINDLNRIIDLTNKEGDISEGEIEKIEELIEKYLEKYQQIKTEILKQAVDKGIEKTYPSNEEVGKTDTKPENHAKYARGQD